LPPNVNADISATTVNGGISSELDLVVKKSPPGGRKLEGKLGQGGPMVKLTTVNGAVHIDRARTASPEKEG
jgi:hypothetical protein